MVTIIEMVVFRCPLVFSGDTLLSEDVGRTDLPGEPATRKSIVERLRCPRETRMYPGHSPYTGLDREIKHNLFFL